MYSKINFKETNMKLSKTTLKIILAINVLLILIAFFFLGYTYYILNSSTYDVAIAACIIILGGLFATFFAMYAKKE